VLVVVADVHERASGVPAALRALGAQVELQALAQGDYVVGYGTVVERKTVADLHASIGAGRFWQQMKKIRDGGRSPQLVIEGRTVFQGPIGRNAVRGLCLAVADLGVTIIRTEDQEDTAGWLFTLADRRSHPTSRDRPPYAQRPRSPHATPAEAALAAAPGVSVATARNVLRRFGSLREIGDMSVDELQAVEGIGPKRAAAVAALIRNRWDYNAF